MIRWVCPKCGRVVCETLKDPRWVGHLHGVVFVRCVKEQDR